jgi:DNA-binding transcriptional ArsR family regulator
MPTNRRKPSVPSRDLTLTSPGQLHALADPTRWKILGRLIDGPASIQELSRTFTIPKGTIGHHVGVLEDAGLIRVAETHRVRGVTEKRYARVARTFRFPEEGRAAFAAQAGDPTLANLPLRQAIAEARVPTGPDDPSASVVVRSRMPAERARRFARLVEALAAEFADGAPGVGETFGFVAAIYVPEWASTPDGTG